MKSPLVDVAAILMCAALVILIGQYYIHKKQNEVFQVPSAAQKPVKLMEAPAKPKIDLSKFEAAVKHTE
jgi:hypothetical protein